MNLDNIKDPIFLTGRKVLNILSEHGEAYIVGGAVRDLVMGNQIHDVDISTNVPMEVIEALFETHDIGKNKDFGIVVVNVDGINFEIAQFRSDGAYTDGRRPDTVELGVSFKEDTKRRDFTMNALGMDLEGNILDFHGGLEDIKYGRLRTVGHAFDRFEEDLLRILRAVRFAARFDYQLDEEICEAISQQKNRLSSVAMERVRDEMLKTISYGASKFAKALWIMEKVGLIEHVFPGISEVPGRSMFTNGKFLQEFILAMRDMPTITDPVIVLGALFHNMTREECESLCHYLKLTSEETKEILYINKHMLQIPNGSGGEYHYMHRLDVQYVLKMIQNHTFQKLKVVYGLMDPWGYKQEKLIAEILEYVPVQQKQKDVNAILLAMNFKGKEFGEMQSRVNKWMFNEFGKNKTLKTDSEVKDFILSALKEDCDRES